MAAVVVDCADPRALARFWGEVTVWALHDASDDHARLNELGATDVDVGQGDVPWVCLADPEGNDFCVLGRG
ncbi:VOC family protein [Isoptericola halotolerans]|uniref:VOC family protein n=1 Tax=Isoptericola halotolerans TaxID=300560 RepID=UPI00388E45FA